MGRLLAGIVALVVAGFASSFLAPLAVQRWLGLAWTAIGGLRRARVDGPRGPLVVREGGRGRPVVLVHGFAEEAGGLAALAVRLRRHARVIVPDMPGHGASAPLAGADLDLEDWVDALDVLVRREGGPVVLVGHSLGGWASVLYAQRHPERVAALVLVHAAGLAWPDGHELLLGRTRSEVQALVQHMTPWPVRLPGVTADALGRHLRTPRLHALHADLMRRGMVAGDLEAVRVPVHLLWGPGDGFFPPEVATRAAERFPRAQVHPLGPGGHLPVLFRAGEVTRAVRLVLASI